MIIYQPALKNKIEVLIHRLEIRIKLILILSAISINKKHIKRNQLTIIQEENRDKEDKVRELFMLKNHSKIINNNNDNIALYKNK